VSVRLSVCLSVCPIYRPLQQRAAGLLLWARRANDVERLLRAVCLLTYRKLNTDVSLLFAAARRGCQIGAFFMLNLCLVVIATQFAETKRRETESMVLGRPLLSGGG